MKVALFLSCVNDGLFPNTGRAVVDVLERLGHVVVFPVEQTCCGQMHFNSGYRDEGLRLAKHFCDVFGEFDAVVSPSASCAGAVRELYANAARATNQSCLEDEFEDLKAHVYEFSEFLTHVLRVVDVGARFSHRVAYHPTCHSLRVLGLGDAPRTLLSHVRDLELVNIVDDDQCCGFGGLFSLKNSEVSTAIGKDKFDHVRKSGAEFLCAVDNSCLMHIGGIASRSGSPLQTIHLAEILASQ